MVLLYAEGLRGSVQRFRGGLGRERGEKKEQTGC